MTGRADTRQLCASQTGVAHAPAPGTPNRQMARQTCILTAACTSAENMHAHMHAANTHTCRQRPDPPLPCRGCRTRPRSQKCAAGTPAPACLYNPHRCRRQNCSRPQRPRARRPSCIGQPPQCMPKTAWMHMDLRHPPRSRCMRLPSACRRRFRHQAQQPPLHACASPSARRRASPSHPCGRHTPATP